MIDTDLPCTHNFIHLGRQWWDDERLRPGSGATYANVYFCTHCLEKVIVPIDSWRNFAENGR